MRFAIVGVDRPGRERLRAETRPAHLEYVKTAGAGVVLAGPLLDEAGERPVGSLLIMEFADLGAARAFAAADPYTTAGVFESVTIRPWRQVLP